ncbi:TPA: exosome complex protein Rrp42 [Candidatus Micrarchaeota archaeon]|nr:exosome complex protein Rrp42 [Candidatus Micrarchaeota archaeon]
MADTFKEMIMHGIRRDVLLNLLKKGLRFDNRKFDELRPAELKKGVLDTAEGSALARLGRSQVLAAVKFDISVPYPDKPNEGTIVTGAEFLPTASPTFEPGPPDENAIELARVIDRGIRSAEIVDTKSLFIEEGKALSCYIDLYILDHGGNLIDTAGLAAMGALMDTKVPKVENGKIVRNEHIRSLNPKSKVIASSFAKTGDYWLVDPSLEEEVAADTSITITTTETHVCSMQKRHGSLTKSDLMDCIDLAFKKGDELRRLL